MSGTSAKRVVLYRFDRQPSEGLVSGTRFALNDRLEMMSPGGNLETLHYGEIKVLCYVTDSGPANLFVEYQLFERRPKLPGLWVRFAFRDGDVLDGVLSHHLPEWPEAGFLATPPRAGASRQRVFVPRAALIGTELLGIIGKRPAARRDEDKAGKAKPSKQDQLSMFDQLEEQASAE